MVNKTELATNIPGQQTHNKSRQIFEKAVDEKKKMNEFIWLLKG